MMTNRWGEGGLTIVLLPSGQLGDELLTVAKQWTDLKLLSQAVWVRPEFLDTSISNPPKQKALILGEDRDGSALEVEVDLFEQLARQQLLLVRLLVVRSVSESVGFDTQQDELGNVLEKYLTVALPLPVSAGYDRDSYTQFLRLNLVCAPTEFEMEQGSRLLSGKFNANFVAAAEDRSAPLAGDAFMRHEPPSMRFASFTMMHVAAVGALWQGLPKGLYELLNPSGGTGSQTYLSRVFASAILTDGLARRASARVLKRVADPQTGAVDFATELPVEGTYQIPDSEHDKYIESMVNLTFEFDDRKLSYRPSPEAERVDAIQRSMSAETSNFLLFVWDKMSAMPIHMAKWAHRRTAKALNVLLHGGDDTGYASVKLPEEHFDPRDQVVMENRERILIEKEKADLALVSPVTPSEVRSTPALWTNIRDLVFGMLDASNLERLGYPESENGWPIFYRVSDLFADPATKIEVAADEGEPIELSWSKSTDAVTVMGDVSQFVVHAQRKRDAALREVVEGSATLASIEARIEELEAFLNEDDDTVAPESATAEGAR